MPPAVTAPNAQFSPNPVPSPDSPEAAFPGAETIPMVFPVDVLLTITAQKRVRFKQGIQQVPKPIADDPAHMWWLEKNGVKSYKSDPSQPGVITAQHLEHMQKQGLKVKDVASAQAFFDMLPDDQQKKLLDDVAGVKGGRGKKSATPPPPPTGELNDEVGS